MGLSDTFCNITSKNNKDEEEEPKEWCRTWGDVNNEALGNSKIEEEEMKEWRMIIDFVQDEGVTFKLNVACSIRFGSIIAEM